MSLGPIRVISWLLPVSASARLILAGCWRVLVVRPKTSKAARRTVIARGTATLAAMWWLGDFVPLASAGEDAT